MFSSSGVRRCVIGQAVSDVSKDRRGSKSKGRAAQYCSLLNTDTCPKYLGGVAVQFDGNTDTCPKYLSGVAVQFDGKYVFGKENVSK
jgi:hypothetical protein